MLVLIGRIGMLKIKIEATKLNGKYLLVTYHKVLEEPSLHDRRGLLWQSWFGTGDFVLFLGIVFFRRILVQVFGVVVKVVAQDGRSNCEN